MKIKYCLFLVLLFFLRVNTCVAGCLKLGDIFNFSGTKIQSIQSQEELDEKLCSAVNFDNFEEIVILRKMGANLNGKYVYELRDAILDFDLDAIKCLLAAGVNPNLRFSNNNTHLHILSSEKSDNNFKMVKFLLKYGADPNLKNKDGDTVLFVAVKENNIKIVKLLKRYGAKYS